MNHQPIVNQAKVSVVKFMEEHRNEKLIYHTLSHTETIVEIAQQLGTDNGLSNDDLTITLVAAWFIDTGYYENSGKHEELSAQIAENFLIKSGVAGEIIKGVKNCLLATRTPQKPVTMPEQIVCDAAFFYLAATDFGEQNKLMRKELCLLHGMEIEKNEWRRRTIQLIEAHSYFTDYGKKHLAKRKKDNLEKLKKKEAAAFPRLDPITALLQSRPVAMTQTDMKEENRKNNPERTIETMFRITADKNQRLSDQADTKSNIMISVNVIIISVLLTVLLPKLDNNNNLVVPVMILLTVSLLTIIFSILSTQPHIPPGTFTMDDVKDKKVNLMFFGNFYKMNFEQYTEGMLQIMEERHFLYLNLLRDNYTQGVRLGQKYKMLKMAYTMFMYGLILSIIAFVIAGVTPGLFR